MPGLDEYYQYLDKQDKTQKPDDPAKNGAGKNGKPKKPRLPDGPVPGSGQPGVRYVLRGGVTVAVPAVKEDLEPVALRGPVVITEPVALRGAAVFPVPVVIPPVAAPAPDRRTGKIGDAPRAEPDEEGGDLDESLEPGDPTALESDYLPPLVEAAEPTEVADANTRPRRPRAADPADDISDGDAAALWKRLPRHIQLLVGMAPETKEEPAQKYYSRGFKESRQQLIERLLDPTMTLEDTARVLGVCPTTVRRYTNRGVLPHYRTLGQQRRFRLSDVLAFLEKQQKQAAKRRKMLFGENA